MSTEFEQKLQLMSEKFRIELPIRYQEIDRLFDSMTTSMGVEDLSLLKQQLHRLTGSAGTFGLDKVSAASLKLEAFLDSDFGWQSTASKEILFHLRDQLSLEVGLSATRNKPIKNLGNSLNEISSPTIQKRIVVIEDDVVQAEHYQNLLTQYGYLVDVYIDIEQCAAQFSAVSESMDMPTLFIVDMMLGEDKHAGSAFIEQLQQQGINSLPPVIFASAYDDFESRLAAVRAGGSRYFVKPFSDEHLLDSIRSLTEKETPPYRVLIIDDDQEVVDYFMTTMQNAGITAKGIINPLEAFEQLKQFQPELILIDIHMPECNGLELAAMIRHQESYAKLPIVFLSADYRLQSRLSAMTLGADDFIQKGIEPYQIVASVKSRLNKARLIETLTNKLTKAREKAEKMSQSKSKFLSFISHELKTPLNSILGFSQLLKADELSEEQHEMVANIYNSGEMQLGLINDLLDLAMIEEGKIKLHPDTHSLNEIVKDSVSFFQIAARQMELNIEVSMPDDIELYIDGRRLQQILLNLLSNAVKYNKKQGRIMLSVVQANDEIKFIIEDTGRGISAQSMVNIFSPFERHGAENSTIEGTGLGLGIIKSLTELMGGNITVSSTLNQGSLFTVTLPLSASDPDSQRGE